MTQLLTIENATQYLENNDFTNIQFSGENNNCLYFSAIDEDDTFKFIEFDPAYEDRIIVSVRDRKEDSWIILEILED
jgi:hypothetical protein